MSFISKEDLLKVKEFTVLGVAEILSKANDSMQTVLDWRQEDYSLLIECLAFIIEVQKSGLLVLPEIDFDISGDFEKDCANITQYIRNVQSHVDTLTAKLHLEQTREKMRIGLGTQFYYEFTDGDLRRIYAILIEAREITLASQYFQDDYKARLIAKIEKLRNVLRKRVSDLDCVYSLLGDIGIISKKYSSHSENLVFLFSEVIRISWRTQCLAEEMPSDLSVPSIFL